MLDRLSFRIGPIVLVSGVESMKEDIEEEADAVNAGGAWSKLISFFWLSLKSDTRQEERFFLENEPNDAHLSILRSTARSLKRLLKPVVEGRLFEIEIWKHLAFPEIGNEDLLVTFLAAAFKVVVLVIFLICFV